MPENKYTQTTAKKIGGDKTLATTTSTAAHTDGAVTTTLLPDDSMPAYPPSAHGAEMYFLSPRLTQLALQKYAALDVTPEAADDFFETFGPGNIREHPDRPYERFSDYETLLKLLFDQNPTKYQSNHKGTPFYYMSWLAFDLRNFEKALFYMDAAISEDVQRWPGNWLEKPAGSFLTLNIHQDAPPAIRQVAQRTIEVIERRMVEQIKRFNAVSTNNCGITFPEFIDKFVRGLVQDAPQRTIISALYVYLLEFDERYRELCLRSEKGGSIAPFVIHLFKGGLIFESLLKLKYKGDTLERIFQDNAFQTDFPSVKRKVRAKSLKGIIGGIQDDSIDTAFRTTAKLRNTTGHKLVWDDVFADLDQYKRLFEQEVNALLYLVARKFVTAQVESGRLSNLAK